MSRDFIFCETMTKGAKRIAKRAANSHLINRLNKDSGPDYDDPYIAAAYIKKSTTCRIGLKASRSLLFEKQQRLIGTVASHPAKNSYGVPFKLAVGKLEGWREHHK